jgi:hypothetical protein
MTNGGELRDSTEVRDDFFRVIRYTSYWILYGFMALVIVASCAAAFQGMQR